MKPATISILSIAGTLGLVAAIGFAQPDGIEPPPGMVMDTQPSLTSIDQKLDVLSANIDGISSATSSSNVQVLYLESGTQSQPTAIQVTSGPTRVLAISGWRTNAVLFDGPGSFNGGGGNVISGNAIGRISYDTQQIIGSGAGQSFVSRHSTNSNLNVIAQNGLYAAYSIGGWVAIYYEELNP